MELSKIEEYLKDLKELKVAIKEKHNLSREIFSPRAFRFYGLISAIFILVFPSLWHLLLKTQPLKTTSINTCFLIALVFLSIIWTVLKFVIVSKIFYKKGLPLSYFKIAQMILSDGGIHLYLPSLILLFVAAISLPLLHLSWLLIPLFGIILSICCINLGGFIDSIEYLVTGYLLLIGSFPCFFFAKSYPLICIALLYSIVFFVYAAIAYRTDKKRDTSSTRKTHV